MLDVLDQIAGGHAASAQLTLDGVAAFQGGVQAGDGVDMGALRDQTAFNIREGAGRRKQKPLRRSESRSKRIRSFFGIRGLGWSGLVA